MKNYLKYLLTGIVVLVAVLVALFKYKDYVTNPWTRDGQVRAVVTLMTYPETPHEGRVESLGWGIA